MSMASDLLQAYYAAELAILRRQSYTIGDHVLTFADLAEVRRERRELEKRVQSETTAALYSTGTGPRYSLGDFSR